MLQKNIYILRNVLVWTCINLWIMILMINHMVLQRFYCCGTKVVLSRQSKALKKKSFWWVISFGIESKKIKNNIRPAGVKISLVFIGCFTFLKIFTSIIRQSHVTARSQVSRSKHSFTLEMSGIISPCCKIYLLLTRFRWNDSARWIFLALVLWWEGVQRRRKHQGHVDKTI